MELANIPHVVKDEARNNTYTFYAYRELKAWEVRRLLGAFFSGTKRVGKNKQYKMFTLIGGRDPIGPGGRQ